MVWIFLKTLATNLPYNPVTPLLGIHPEKSEFAQSCLTLCNPMDCSLPGSSVHGIFQGRVLEWVANFFSRGSSWPWDQAQVSRLVGRHFYHLSHQGSPNIYPEKTTTLKDTSTPKCIILILLLTSFVSPCFYDSTLVNQTLIFLIGKSLLSLLLR